MKSGTNFDTTEPFISMFTWRRKASLRIRKTCRTILSNQFINPIRWYDTLLMNSLKMSRTSWTLTSKNGVFPQNQKSTQMMLRIMRKSFWKEKIQLLTLTLFRTGSRYDFSLHSPYTILTHSVAYGHTPRHWPQKVSISRNSSDCVQALTYRKCEAGLFVQTSNVCGRKHCQIRQFDPSESIDTVPSPENLLGANVLCTMAHITHIGERNPISTKALGRWVSRHLERRWNASEYGRRYESILVGYHNDCLALPHPFRLARFQKWHQFLATKTRFGRSISPLVTHFPHLTNNCTYSLNFKVSIESYFSLDRSLPSRWAVNDIGTGSIRDHRLHRSVESDQSFDVLNFYSKKIEGRWVTENLTSRCDGYEPHDVCIDPIDCRVRYVLALVQKTSKLVLVVDWIAHWRRLRLWVHHDDSAISDQLQAEKRRTLVLAVPNVSSSQHVYRRSLRIHHWNAHNASIELFPRWFGLLCVRLPAIHLPSRPESSFRWRRRHHRREKKQLKVLSQPLFLLVFDSIQRSFLSLIQTRRQTLYPRSPTPMAPPESQSMGRERGQGEWNWLVWQRYIVLCNFASRSIFWCGIFDPNWSLVPWTMDAWQLWQFEQWWYWRSLNAHKSPVAIVRASFSDIDAFHSIESKCDYWPKLCLWTLWL